MSSPQGMEKAVAMFWRHGVYRSTGLVLGEGLLKSNAFHEPLGVFPVLCLE